MRTLFAGTTAFILALNIGALEAGEPETKRPRDDLRFESHAQGQDGQRLGARVLGKLFPPARQTPDGCTVRWGGGLNEGRIMVRRVTSC